MLVVVLVVELRKGLLRRQERAAEVSERWPTRFRPHVRLLDDPRPNWSPRNRRRSTERLRRPCDDLVGVSKELVAVSVRKRRVHYTLARYMVELTGVRTDRAATRTIAVEAEDPARDRSRSRARARLPS